MGKSCFTRRDVLKMGAAAGAGSALAGCGAAHQISSALSGCAKITDIDTVVILIQENRSFDHYFGSYKGVRGFNDQSAAFQQPYPGNASNAPAGVLLPFHLDMSKTNAACTHDISHDWVPQHQSWNNGAMNGFVTSRIPINATDAVMTMGYYTRADLPFYYAVADAFTLCDNYCCPVIGPSDPNRLYTMAASLDPDGTHGGPLLESLVFGNRQPFFGKLTLTTMPEQLQTRGISWKVYGSPDQNILGGAFSDNILSYFKNFQDPSSELYQNAFTPQFPTDFISDAASGNLPQVSWILASLVDSDHPPAPATLGETTLSLIVRALMANPIAWAKTALFVTYDENGGFFDHVPPVTAPPGTPGEYVTAPSVPDASAEGGIGGPIGLGFRVPCMIIAPFSRGGFVSSDLFDHTSILRFLETRFGAEAPNLSAWRRQTVGDMTSAFNFTKPDYSIPSLPSTTSALQSELTECLNNLAGFEPYALPSPQQMPTQEAGTPTRPSGTC
ncbi:MAG TPA: alkaline phosphatase family protein [Terracidiphilus sp.]|jgi:phospholipase C|nr:alkaline phosphatase family protein [Terracidiphilus sp.]